MIGLFMISGRLSDFNSLIPTDLALWLAGVEEALDQLLQLSWSDGCRHAGFSSWSLASSCSARQSP
jgi:hypothetical protein